VQTNDAGQYRLVVRNLARPSGVASTLVTLTVLADVDGDGMPDIWEGTNQLNSAVNDAALDADNDGHTNGEEYTAGTDPQDPESYLKVDGIESTGSATLWFQAMSNKTYTVQYTDSLGSGLWSKLEDIVARGANRTETVFDPFTGAERYYRLATPRLP